MGGRRSIVSVARVEGDVASAVREALERAEWTQAVPAKADVSLKVNLGWDLFIPGSITSPLMAEALIQAIRDHVGTITMVESDQVLEDVEKAFHESGMAEVCRRNGVRWLNMTRAPTVPLEDSRQCGPQADRRPAGAQGHRPHQRTGHEDPRQDAALRRLEEPVGLHRQDAARVPPRSGRRPGGPQLGHPAGPGRDGCDGSPGGKRAQVRTPASGRPDPVLVGPRRARHRSGAAHGDRAGQRGAPRHLRRARRRHARPLTNRDPRPRNGRKPASASSPRNTMLSPSSRRSCASRS